MIREPVRMAELILLAARRRALKKAIFSKPDAKEQLKTVVTLRAIGKREVLQAECFTADNKAIHKNLTVEEAASQLEQLAASHGQVNLLTTAGDCELRRSKNRERFTLQGDEKLERRLNADAVAELTVEGNDRGKQRILSGEESFLKHLGVSDQNGRIHDKKQAKFRQINRFLEFVEDILPALPKHRELTILDFGCGKSYLTFALYHYLYTLKGYEVRIVGLDLKKDVIARCNRLAQEYGYTRLEFLCGDIADYTGMNAVHQGAVTFTGQNMGAEKPERVKPILYNCFLITMMIALTLTGAILAFRTPLLSLYGVTQGVEGSLESMAFNAASLRMWMICAPYFVCGLMDDCSGVLRGLGKSLLSTIITLIGTCLLRVAWILIVFPLNPTLETIFVCYPITWLLTGFVSFAVIQTLLKRIMKEKNSTLCVDDIHSQGE